MNAGHTEGPMDEVSLRGMQFHTLVGILPHEQEFAQPLEVDLTARVPAGAGVLDYRVLYAAVRETIDAGPVGYLEDTAERIAARVLAETPAASVRVAMRKPHVPLGGPLAHSEVVLERRRRG